MEMLHLPEGDYVGVQEASKIIGCHERSVKRLMEQYRLRFYKFQPNVVIFPLSDVKRAAEQPSTIGRPRGS